VERRELGAKTPQTVGDLAGLPSELMASLVQDMAQAIVAMLMDQQVESDECAVESGDLRQV